MNVKSSNKSKLNSHSLAVNLCYFCIISSGLIFSTSQLFDINLRSLFLITLLTFTCIIANYLTKNKTLSKNLGASYIDLKGFKSKINSYGAIILTGYYFLLLAKYYLNPNRSCDIGINICSIDNFWGGWDTQYSYMFRAFSVIHMAQPYSFLKELTHASVDYPIAVPSLLALLISGSIKFTFILPAISLLASFSTLIILLKICKNNLQSLLVFFFFAFYPLHKAMLFNAYPDTIVALLLLTSFYYLLVKKSPELFFKYIVLLPLIKLEGIFHLILSIFFAIKVKKINMKEILKKDKTAYILILILYCTQAILRYKYGGNQLTNNMIFDLSHFLLNIKVLASSFLNAPYIYSYLFIFICIPFIRYKLISYFFIYLAIFLLIYTAVVGFLPNSVPVNFYINVTLDRLFYTFMPIQMFLVLYCINNKESFVWK
jgi:hypothetical protein